MSFFRYGNTPFHIPQENLMSYRIAFGLSKNSKYKHLFKSSFKKLNEGGLINVLLLLLKELNKNVFVNLQKFIQKELDRVGVIATEASSELNDPKAWKLHDLQGPFYLQLISLVLIAIIFLIEISINRSLISSKTSKTGVKEKNGWNLKQKVKGILNSFGRYLSQL